MKAFYKKVLATIGFLAICSTVAEATPAFARQMNSDCMTCHFQNIPKLNSFGREFKLSGFTMTGGTAEITSEQGAGLALPSTLNFGFVTKARIHKTGDTDRKTEIFDEAAFIFGGKIADGVGTSMEFVEGLAGGKIVFTTESDAGRVGLTYFMTDALGAFSGMEVYSTGLYRPIRQFENRKKANIFQKLGIGAGQATGIQAYYYGNGLTATIGQYAPVYANSATTGSIMKNIARASYNINKGGFNIAIGGYYLGGDVTELAAMNAGNDKLHGTDLSAFDRESTGVDFQVEGDVGSMSMMVTGGIVLSNTYSQDLNTSQPKDQTGFSVGVQLNPTPLLGVKAALLSYTDNNNADNDLTAITIGSDFMYAQNIRLGLEVTQTSLAKEDSNGDKSELDLLFMAMIAF